jgi:hypothetical protein
MHLRGCRRERSWHNFTVLSPNLHGRTEEIQENSEPGQSVYRPRNEPGTWIQIRSDTASADFAIKECNERRITVLRNTVWEHPLDGKWTCPEELSDFNVFI